MIRLVLDTNTMVSANLNDQGLEAAIVSLALNKKVQLCVSAPIIEEYERVLLYSRLKFIPKEVVAFLARLRSNSLLATPTKTVSESADEADNRFLECAGAASADYLATGNRRHVPRIWKTTEVVSARESLGFIGSSFLK